MLLAPVGLEGHSPCSLITPNGDSPECAVITYSRLGTFVCDLVAEPFDIEKLGPSGGRPYRMLLNGL